MRNIDLPDDCSAYIASRLDSNIGSSRVPQASGLALLEGRPIDLDLYQKAIGERSARPEVETIWFLSFVSNCGLRITIAFQATPQIHRIAKADRDVSRSAREVQPGEWRLLR